MVDGAVRSKRISEAFRADVVNITYKFMAIDGMDFEKFEGAENDAIRNDVIESYVLLAAEEVKNRARTLSRDAVFVAAIRENLNNI